MLLGFVAMPRAQGTVTTISSAAASDAASRHHSVMSACGTYDI